MSAKQISCHYLFIICLLSRFLLNLNLNLHSTLFERNIYVKCTLVTFLKSANSMLCIHYTIQLYINTPYIYGLNIYCNLLKKLFISILN